MLKDEVLTQLRAFYRTNAEQFSLKKMGLFGSVARGEESKESDIDIVVEFEKPNLLKQAELMLQLKRLLGREVDVIALWNRMNPHLRERIEKEAIYV